MQRAKKKAGTNSGSKGDATPSPFAQALDALRETYLGPDQGEPGKIGTLVDETLQCEASTKRAILKVHPTERLPAFISGFDEWQGKVCAWAVACYHKCFKLAINNQAELDAPPADFAESFTMDCLSKFLGVALSDGAEKPERASNGRVRWFIRHAYGDYSDEFPDLYPGYAGQPFRLPHLVFMDVERSGSPSETVWESVRTRRPRGRQRD